MLVHLQAECAVVVVVVVHTSVLEDSYFISCFISFYDQKRVVPDFSYNGALNRVYLRTGN
jgi:hypothetical protein